MLSYGCKRNTTHYEHDSAGTALNFTVVSEAVSKMRMTDTMAMGALFDEEDVLAPIRDDFKKRHKK